MYLSHWREVLTTMGFCEHISKFHHQFQKFCTDTEESVFSYNLMYPTEQHYFTFQLLCCKTNDIILDCHLRPKYMQVRSLSRLYIYTCHLFWRQYFLPLNVRIIIFLVLTFELGQPMLKARPLNPCSVCLELNDKEKIPKGINEMKS